MKYLLTAACIWSVLTYFIVAVAPRKVSRERDAFYGFNALLSFAITYLLYLWENS